MASESKKVAVIGTGVIGNGWITRFLANGFDVVAFDPAEGAAERTRDTVERAWESVKALGLKEGASKDRLTFVSTLEEAVQDADLIQENVPERVELKQSVLRDIDISSKSDAVIGSSTSGIKRLYFKKH